MHNYNLAGKILIAHPKVSDPIFQKGVIYLHTNDATGSVGILLNAPMKSDIAEKWSTELGWEYPELIYHGGPNEQHLGYVIHSADYAVESTIHLNAALCYTSGKQILDDICRATGPHQFLLLTGYTAWKPGELEKEIDQNEWLVVDYDAEYFFQELDREAGWKYAIQTAAKNKTQELFDAIDTK